MRRLKSVTCAVAAILLLSAAVHSPVLGPFSVDVVSAATETSEQAAPEPAPAPAPTSAPASAAPKAPAASKASSEATVLLTVGSNGSAVELLQTKLNAYGYGLKVDGIFGERTLDAVKDYQGKNGLKVDGIVGPKTLAKLNPETSVPAAPAETPAPVEQPAQAEQPDVVTTASIVSSKEAFLNAISKDGTWIAASLNDLAFDQELILEGEFTNKEKLDRKIALYTQDENRVVLERFTLTAPKLTIKSPNTRLQGGTFVGDVYVRAANFAVKDAKVEGNVYFVTQEAKDTFTMDDKSTITGSQILADVDVVATASIVDTAAAFEKAISSEGAWIICPLRDLTIDKELVVEGEFRKKDLPENDLYRKIGLYTHNDPSDKSIVTHRFTLTAPKLTIKSPNTSLQHGIFVGDIYVESTGFALADQKVEGNVYFATQEAMDTFTMDEASSITGVQILADVDVVTTASIVSSKEAFLNAISKDGTWIAASLNDLAFDQELVLEGEFTNKEKLDRKIALYTQDENRVVLERFTLTAPKLTIKSPNTRLQGGTFVGDVYVRAANFAVKDAKVEGNVYFVTQEAKDTFTMDDKSSITGSQILADVDVVATASIVDTAAAFEKAISPEGAWIICPLRDLTIDKELVVEGEFRKKNLPENDLYRKIGLYTHNDPSDKSIVTHRFTLTAPKLTIKSPNTSLQHGIFVGDVYVESTGFALADQKVEGNIYFATQEAMDTFTMDEASSITGAKELKAN